MSRTFPSLTGIAIAAGTDVYPLPFLDQEDAHQVSDKISVSCTLCGIMGVHYQSDGSVLVALRSGDEGTLSTCIADRTQAQWVRRWNVVHEHQVSLVIGARRPRPRVSAATTKKCRHSSSVISVSTFALSSNSRRLQPSSSTGQKNAK
jgi:hypothetical protein